MPTNLATAAARSLATQLRFVLAAALDTTPAGATGQLIRPDDFHVTLAFDHYPDLVFDILDTDPAVWSAVMILVANGLMALKYYLDIDT